MSLAITPRQAGPRGAGRRAGHIRVFSGECLHSEGSFGLALSELLLSIVDRTWLAVPSPWQPGKWKREVVTFLIERIKHASSQQWMADWP